MYLNKYGTTHGDMNHWNYDGINIYRRENPLLVK